VLLVGQSSVDKNVGMEAQDIVGNRYQAAADENLEDWEDFLCAVINYWMCELAIAL
jgi:hypothetical protein